MTRLLIYEPSFRRLETDLAHFGDRLQPLLMGRDGAITAAGEPVAADDARPEIAWANAELFQSKAARDYMVTLLKSPDLKWLQSAAAGFDHPIFHQLAAKGVRLTTSHGQAVGMADYVVHDVLDCFQRGPERRAAQAERVWRRLPFREVNGSRWLIVGFGAVGRGVAERARAFGATITGVRRDPAPDPLADEIAPLDRLLELAATADVVVLCVPLGATTRHIAGDAFFAAMKEGAVLVNVGRGGLVDEAALLRGLGRGAPGHAVLDVFEVEPLPPDSPLWTHPGVTITAHASGITAGEGPRNEQRFLENLGRYLDGRALLSEVSPREFADAPLSSQR